MRDALGALESVLVLGGGSDIALATVKELAKERTRTVILAGRDTAKLEPVADELRAAGVTTVDLVDVRRRRHRHPPGRSSTASGPPTPTSTWSCSAFGVLGDQDAFDEDPAAAADAAIVNYAGAVSSGLAVAKHLKAQGHGTLAVITSVAGERTRADNFVYGSTKAGLDAFTQGLGDRLGRHRRLGHGRPPRLRPHLDDRGHGGRPDGHHRRRRRQGHRRRAPQRRPHRLVAGQAPYVFAVLKVLPRPVWRKLAAQR